VDYHSSSGWLSRGFGAEVLPHADCVEAEAEVRNCGFSTQTCLFPKFWGVWVCCWGRGQAVCRAVVSTTLGFPSITSQGPQGLFPRSGQLEAGNLKMVIILVRPPHTDSTFQLSGDFHIYQHYVSWDLEKRWYITAVAFTLPSHTAQEHWALWL
jgi:hypothetical protein